MTMYGFILVHCFYKQYITLNSEVKKFGLPFLFVQNLTPKNTLEVFTMKLKYMTGEKAKKFTGLLMFEIFFIQFRREHTCSMPIWLNLKFIQLIVFIS